MDRGRPGFRQGSTCPALLRYRTRESGIISHTRLSRSQAGLPRPFRYVPVFFQLSGSSPCGPTTPFKWFGLLPFRSPLLWESLLISFPELLRWFTSLSLALPDYFIHPPQCTDRSVRVTPFGNPGINGYVLLPPAFRSLSRPSSPRSSQASTINLFSLDHIIFSSVPADRTHPVKLSQGAVRIPRLRVCTAVTSFPVRLLLSFLLSFPVPVKDLS